MNAKYIFSAVLLFVSCSLLGCGNKTTTVSAENPTPRVDIQQNTTVTNELRDDYYVSFEENGCYLVNPISQKKVVGPYAFLFDDIRFKFDSWCRYIDSSGLIGFVSKYGDVISAKYSEAEPMQNGIACVREAATGLIIYINEEGKPITEEKFIEGKSFGIGNYTSVKKADGYALIDKDGKTLCSGFSAINPFQGTDVLISGVKDGHAEIFAIILEKEEPYQVWRVFPEYSAVSAIYFHSFAYVQNTDRMVGVIDVLGNAIVSPQYISVEHQIISDGTSGSEYGKNVVFLCHKEDGSIDVIHMEIEMNNQKEKTI